ncbi:MAG: ABC transporter ATP-binding protein [Gammaproteobacteria bacterium]
MSVPMLELAGVTKRYGARAVLDGIDLVVGTGEALGLVGVNGAGKTTLIRGLLDLNRIDGGRIVIAGRGHTETGARAALSYLAERFNPPRFATGAEFLRHALALHGARFDAGAAADEAARLDLDPAALCRPVREYSKGMAQKLGLVAAILPRTPLLVLDEPMSGLDPKARALVKRRLGELHAAGATLFFSTHLLADVEALCERIALLHGGRIVFSGPPGELLARHGCATLEAAFLAAIDAPVSATTA